MKVRKPSKYSADVIVIGSGPVGSVAAQILAEKNKNVIIIEQEKIGGDCAHHSCIPSRVFLDAATTADHITHIPRHGISVGAVTVDFQATKHWAQRAINASGVAHDERFLYADPHIQLVKGRAQFVDPYTVSANGNAFTARSFIIATGSSPTVPDIQGLATVPYLTYRSIMGLNELPASVAIIGNGSTAYEYAQIFRMFGVRTHLVSSDLHLLSSQDSELSDIAESSLAQRGVLVHTGAAVQSIQQTNHGNSVVSYNHATQSHHISVHAVFVAAGNNANVDISLSNAHVTHDDTGIKVSHRMKTSQKHIYAVGGVTTLGDTAGAAIRQGQIAAHNILHRKNISYDARAVPIIAYGEPELVSIGKTEREVKLTGLPYQTAIAPLGIIGKNMTNPYANGFVKIIATHTGHIIGASMASPYASECVNELSFAIQYRHRACDIANTIHPFLSWSEAIRVAASKIHCA